MLQRRSIRTKLIVALTVLCLIVLLQPAIGIWGMYQHGRAAQKFTAHAQEIPYATDLNRLAVELRESYDESAHAFQSHEGLIEAPPLRDSLGNGESLSQSGFEQRLIGFDVTLQLYEDALEQLASQQTSLADTERRKRNLGQIRETFVSIAKIELDDVTPTRLDSLVDQAHEHLKTVEHGLEGFAEDIRRQNAGWISWLSWSTLVAFAMVGILVVLFRSLVLKPFGTLLSGSRLVAGGQFDHRIDLGTGDELSELANAMNGMSDRFQGALSQVNSYCTDLDRQVRLRTREVIQNEQLASVGYLAAGVAHEINNPLATIAWSSESLQSRVAEIAMMPADQRTIDDETCEALTTNLRRIEEEAYRCKGITEKLLDFSRLSEVRRAETDLVQLVEDVVEMVGKVGKYRCKTLRTHTRQSVVAHVNSQEIRQVVLNLVTNALESVACDGAVDVYVDADDTCGSVIVKDDGCGMNREVLRHLFEPFFTRRRDGTGTGLGLSISYRIVSQHGGSLLAKSDGDGCGSQMQMLLPLTPAHSDEANQNHNTLGLAALGTVASGPNTTAPEPKGTTTPS